MKIILYSFLYYFIVVHRHNLICHGQQKEGINVPFMLLLKHRNARCAGILISTRYVLTTATCAFHDSKKPNGTHHPQLEVLVESYLTGKLSKFYGSKKVNKIFIPHGYHFEKHYIGAVHDIAILELQSPFVMSKYIQAISLELASPAYEKPGTECSTVRAFRIETNENFKLSKIPHQKSVHGDGFKVKHKRDTPPYDTHKSELLERTSEVSDDKVELLQRTTIVNDDKAATYKIIDEIMSSMPQNGNSSSGVVQAKENSQKTRRSWQQHVDQRGFTFEVYKIHIISFDECKNQNHMAGTNLWKSMAEVVVCAKGAPFCEVDYGGPMICGGKLSGLMSRCGPNCSSPFVYQSIYRWKTFIRCVYIQKKCGIDECKNVCRGIEYGTTVTTKPRLQQATVTTKTTKPKTTKSHVHLVHMSKQKTTPKSISILDNFNEEDHPTIPAKINEYDHDPTPLLRKFYEDENVLPKVVAKSYRRTTNYDSEDVNDNGDYDDETESALHTIKLHTIKLHREPHSPTYKLGPLAGQKMWSPETEKFTWHDLNRKQVTTTLPFPRHVSDTLHYNSIASSRIMNINKDAFKEVRMDYSKLGNQNFEESAYGGSRYNSFDEETLQENDTQRDDVTYEDYNDHKTTFAQQVTLTVADDINRQDYDYDYTRVNTHFDQNDFIEESFSQNANKISVNKMSGFFLIFFVKVLL